MYWIDAKYLGMLSPRLPLFSLKSTSPYVAVCRCYICGDSKKNAYKKRGFFFQQKDAILFKCHNCGATRSVSSMLKELDSELKKEYDMENFKEKMKNAPIQVQKKIEHEYITSDNHNSPLKKLKKISQLPVGHPAKEYVQKRGIPPEQHYRLYYCPKFFGWTNSIIPNKFKEGQKDEPRLLIPFFDKNGNMFGYQGRSFDPTVDARYRYFTIMIGGDHTKVFGLDTVDFSKNIYVVEGPLDSLFIPNSLAMAGADIDNGILDKSKTIIVMDNEPRNRDIVKKMNKYIDNGWTLCIWPENLHEKDINDMVMSGQNPIDIINNNLYTGLSAKMKMTTWSKV